MTVINIAKKLKAARERKIGETEAALTAMFYRLPADVRCEVFEAVVDAIDTGSEEALLRLPSPGRERVIEAFRAGAFDRKPAQVVQFRAAS